MLDYLHQVRKEAALRENYDQINLRPEFHSFKDMFLRSKWINFTPSKVDEFFNQGFEKINDSFNQTLDNVIKNLEDKITSVKNLAKLTQ